jgi:hypothetical protein
MILVRPGRECRLGGGGIWLNTILNFLAAFFTPTLALPHRGGGNQFFEHGYFQDRFYTSGQFLEKQVIHE